MEKRSGTVIGREKFNEAFCAQVSGLAKEHCAEISALVDRDPCADLVTLQRLELMGVLHVTSARVDGVLVGYIIWTLAETNVEFSGVPTATQGPWFVRQTYRRSPIGVKLFRTSLSELKDRGIVLVEPHYYIRAEGGERLGSWFEALGAKPVSKTYILNLEKL